jgi:hypothetical protein
MRSPQLPEIAAPELARVTGGALPPTTVPWDDSMSNGCGNGIIDLPNGTWRKACVDHDHAYYDGTGNRAEADWKLRNDMIAQGAQVWLADAYYLGARALGGGYWGNGPPRNPGQH